MLSEVNDIRNNYYSYLFIILHAWAPCVQVILIGMKDFLKNNVFRIHFIIVYKIQWCFLHTP